MDTILKKLLLTVISVFFYISYACANTQTIVVLGDSISAAYGINTHQGWVSLLQTRLKKQGYSHHVLNASISGDTTRTGLNRLKPILKQNNPEIIIIALGGNDGLRGLPFDEIRNSLSGIIMLSQREGSKVILTGVRLPPNYGAVYNSRFKELYQTITDRYNVILIPDFLKNIAEHSELMQADGIHPTVAAQPIILDNIWTGLEPLLNPVKKQ
jgi:acyl-CoA thioesterase-1